MAKKTRSSSSRQPIGETPELSPDLIEHWRRFKTIYPAFLILLVKGDHYVTLDWDAATVSSITGYPLVEGDPDLSYFPIRSEALALRKLTQAGFYLAICHPPDEPKHHFFT